MRGPVIVETARCVRAVRTEKSRGTKLWSCSGPIGVPESTAARATTEEFLEEWADDGGSALKGIIPGEKSVRSDTRG